MYKNRNGFQFAKFKVMVNLCSPRFELNTHTQRRRKKRNDFCGMQKPETQWNASESYAMMMGLASESNAKFFLLEEYIFG